MFVRVKGNPNSPRKSVQIVKSVRDGDQVRQRIVRYVGVAMDDQELEKMKELAEYIKRKIENEHEPGLLKPEKIAQLVIESKKQTENEKEESIKVDLKKLKEEQRTVIGIHQIYGQIYRELGFHNILGRSVGDRSAAEILRHIVMARIANPVSKRASVIQLERDFGIQLNLDRVYRMMDKLTEEVVHRIGDCAFKATCQSLGGKIDVVFVDATTLYFESFIEDSMKQNGYSKDLKFNQPQVLLALLVTQQGLPIGYEAFPGSTYEGHTLVPLLDKLKARYAIGKVVFVADSGLLNANNLAQMEEAGYEYIVGARLRNTSRELQKSMLNLAAYQACEEIDPDDKIKVIELEHSEGRRLIVSHSDKRAKKDAHDRKRAMDKLMAKLRKSQKPQEFISGYGYKKFLKLQNTGEVKLDENKLSMAGQWDGLHGVVTNSTSLKPEEVLAQYRGLWQVEESFRISKHDLKIRPIFHWTPHRIRSHLAIAFMAFTCVRHLEYRVHLQYEKMSPEAIRANLIRVQASVLKDHVGQRYVVPSQGSQHTRKIYQIMGQRYSTTPYRLLAGSLRQS